MPKKTEPMQGPFRKELEDLRKYNFSNSPKLETQEEFLDYLSGIDDHARNELRHHKEAKRDSYEEHKRFIEIYAERLEEFIQLFRQLEKDRQLDCFFEKAEAWRDNCPLPPKHRGDDTISTVLDIYIDDYYASAEAAGYEEGRQSALRDQCIANRADQSLPDLRVVKALLQHGGNVSAAAKELKIERTSLSKRITNMATFYRVKRSVITGKKSDE